MVLEGFLKLSLIQMHRVALFHEYCLGANEKEKGWELGCQT